MPHDEPAPVQVHEWMARKPPKSVRGIARWLAYLKEVTLDKLWLFIASNPSALTARYFTNWTTNIRTRVAIQRPRSDKELRALLVKASRDRRKVRVMGSGHSVAPSVTSMAEAAKGDVLIIQLNKYSAMPKVPDLRVDKQRLRVWVNAGWSLDQMYAAMRKEHPSILLPSQTAGPFFALGGVIANCVHGGNVSFGLINDALTAVRVMDASGAVREVRDEQSLRLYRSSLGQLGILTHVELQCISVASLQAKHRIVSIARAQSSAPRPPLSAPAPASAAKPRETGCVEALIGGGARAYLPASDLVDKRALRAHVLTNMDTEPWQEYFYCCYTGRLLRISWSPSELPPSDAPLEFVADQSAGAPKLKFLDVFGQDLPIMGEKARWSKDGAVKVIDLAFDSVKAALDDDALTDGDMFFLQYATESIFMAYMIPVDDELENVAAALAVVANVAHELRETDAAWKCDLPVEFRFVRGSNRSALSPIYSAHAADPKDGPLWMGIEIPTFTGGSIDATFAKQSNAPTQALLGALTKIEEGWRAISPLAQPHYGKLYGMHRNADGVYSTFDPAITAGIVDAQRKKEFVAEMQRVDPNGLFRREFGDALLGLRGR